MVAIALRATDRRRACAGYRWPVANKKSISTSFRMTDY